MTNDSRGTTAVNPIIAWVNSRLTDVIAATTGVVIGGSEGAVGTGDIIYADSGLTWSIKSAGAQDTILTIDAGGIPDWRVLVSTDLPGGATPALTFSTSNSAGVATGYIASDATLAIFDATVPDTIQPDDAAAAGIAAFAARRDHTHGIVAAIAVDVGTANSEGASTSFSRADHVHDHVSGLGTDLHHAQAHGGGDHDFGPGTPALTFSTTNAVGVATGYIATDATLAIFDATVPNTIQPDDTASAGVVAFAARRDHEHAIVAAAPGTNLSVGSANSEGAATSFGRSDHLHAITTSSNPGAVASVLASAGDGGLQLQRFGVGEDPTVDFQSIFRKDGASHQSLLLLRNSNSPGAAGTGVVILFQLNDAGDVNTNFAGIRGIVADATSGGEEGSLRFDVVANAVNKEAARFVGQSDGSARFGILTINPQASLHVNGTVQIDGASITVADGTTLGQSAGPLLTFDDTNNILKLTGGNLHLNDGSEDKLEIRRGGDVVATESDIFADDAMGIAAETNVHLFVDVLDLTSDSYVAMHRNAETVNGATEFFRFIEDATQYWRWGSVAHGMTDQVPTDVFGAAGFDDTAAGGLSIAGYRDPDAVAGRALVLIGRLGETADTTKSTAGIGVIHAVSQVKSAATVTSVGADGNLFTIANGSNTRWIVDAEGDTHRDGSSNTFDKYDDVMLSRAFAQVTAPDNIIDSGFEQFVKYTKDDLIKARILHKSGFYNESRLLRLHNGAIWQLYIKLQNVVNALIGQGIDLEDLELIVKGV